MPTSSTFLVHHELWLVLEEVSELLLRNDWERRSTGDGATTYYILGFEAHEADVQGGVNYQSEFPEATSVPFPSPPPVLSRWEYAARVAARHGRYVEEARRRLERAGVPAESLELFIRGNKQDAMKLDLNNHEVRAAFGELLEALSLAVRKPSDPLTTEEEQEIARERERLILREIVSKFGQIVRRVEELDPLTVSDPQLEEATRCYLYGFHRSAVVGVAAALETHLKRVTKKTRIETYDGLVSDARSAGFLTPEEEETIGVIFRARNDIVHEGWQPPPKDVLELLKQGRRLVDQLASAGQKH